MKRHDLRLDAAKLAADIQRQRLQQRMGATRVRLSPSRLTFDATQAIEQRVSDTAKLGVDQVKAHPVLAGVGVAAILAWLFRAPLIEDGPDTARRGWDWFAGKVGLSQARLADSDTDEDFVDDDFADDKDVQPQPPPPPGV